MKKNNKTAWPVADAKAHFSQIMRDAHEHGAQFIGTKRPCVLITQDEWIRLTGNKPKMGSWLVSKFSGLGEIEIPDRKDPPREVLFSEKL